MVQKYLLVRFGGLRLGSFLLDSSGYDGMGSGRDKNGDGGDCKTLFCRIVGSLDFKLFSL